LAWIDFDEARQVSLANLVAMGNGLRGHQAGLIRALALSTNPASFETGNIKRE
jgi:hypothetical protein